MSRKLQALAATLCLLAAAFIYARSQMHSTAEAPMAAADQRKYDVAHGLYLKCVELSQRNRPSLDEAHKIQSDTFEALRGDSAHPSVISARKQLVDCASGLLKPEVPITAAPSNNSFKPTPLRGAA